MAKKPTLYQRRVAEGLCGSCGDPRDEGGTKAVCSKCKAKARERAARIRAEKKAAGLCITCGKQPPRDGSTRCQPCLDRQAADQNKRNKSRQAAGLCPCGAEPKEGRTLCQSCIDKRSEHSSKLYHERKEAGTTCVYCDQPRVDGGNVCEHHREHHRQRNRDLKIETLNQYGGCKCKDCGCEDVSILQLDHVNGDGAKHRRELKEKYGESYGGGGTFYYLLKREGYPQEPKLEVVCPSCNTKRHRRLNNHGPKTEQVVLDVSKMTKEELDANPFLRGPRYRIFPKSK